MKNQTISPGEATSPTVQHPANDSIDGATLELLANWRIEDATKSPEDVRAAKKELAEFKRR